MAKWNYNEDLEKTLTAVFGALGTIAILISLAIKGFNVENFMDAIKDIAGLVVVIAVFLIANKLFRRSKKLDFAAVFEKYLKEWIDQNEYLVCENFDEDGKGKYAKRYCSMVIDHSNLVTRKKKAKDAVDKKEKGAFVYLPYLDDNSILRNEFEFRFNSRTFDRQTIYRMEDGDVDLKAIIEQFVIRIDDNFRNLAETKANPSKQTITVTFKETEKNEEYARKLIDMIEYVKTLVIAIA